MDGLAELFGVVVMISPSFILCGIRLDSCGCSREPGEEDEATEVVLDLDHNVTDPEEISQLLEPDLSESIIEWCVLSNHFLPFLGEIRDLNSSRVTGN